VSDPKDITERIFEKADCALRAKIEKDMEPLRLLLNDGQPHRFNTPSTAYDGQKQVVVQVYYRECFRNIQALAFDVLRDKNREAAIRDFMAKVESLDEQLQELRDSIPQ